MSIREGKDFDGDEWIANAISNSISLKLYMDGVPSAHVYTPNQARDLARALFDLADELDPEGAPPR